MVTSSRGGNLNLCIHVQEFILKVVWNLLDSFEDRRKQRKREDSPEKRRYKMGKMQ